jgi:hypothetical protein
LAWVYPPFLASRWCLSETFNWAKSICFFRFHVYVTSSLMPTISPFLHVHVKKKQKSYRNVFPSGKSQCYELEIYCTIVKSSLRNGKSVEFKYTFKKKNYWMIFVGMRIYIYISPTRLVSSFSSFFFFFKVSIFISYTKYENTSEHDASTN